MDFAVFNHVLDHKLILAPEIIRKQDPNKTRQICGVQLNAEDLIISYLAPVTGRSMGNELELGRIDVPNVGLLTCVPIEGKPLTLAELRLKASPHLKEMLLQGLFQALNSIMDA